MKHTALALLLAFSAAQAHEGHGLPGASHWHATDTVGLLMLALGVCAALWWRGRK
jgi:hypothetical protein